MDNDGIPLGFGMALAQYPDAMTAFAALTKKQKDSLLQQAGSAATKDEMQALVRSLMQ